MNPLNSIRLAPYFKDECECNAIDNQSGERYKPRKVWEEKGARKREGEGQSKTQRREHEIGKKQKEFRRHKRHAWEGEKQGGKINTR